MDSFIKVLENDNVGTNDKEIMEFVNLHHHFDTIILGDTISLCLKKGKWIYIVQRVYVF